MNIPFKEGRKQQTIGHAEAHCSGKWCGETDWTVAESFIFKSDRLTLLRRRNVLWWRT